MPEDLLGLDAKSIDRGFINNELLVGNLLEGLLQFIFRHSSELLFHGSKRSLVMAINCQDMSFKTFSSKHRIIGTGKGTGVMKVGHRMVDGQVWQQQRMGIALTRDHNSMY